MKEMSVKMPVWKKVVLTLLGIICTLILIDALMSLLIAFITMSAKNIQPVSIFIWLIAGVFFYKIVWKWIRNKK